MTIRRLMIGIAILGFLLGSAAVAYRSTRLVEELTNPQEVIGWNSTGLILADGRNIPLPGIPTIPSSSIALSNATGRGVEIRPDGRVIGLVRIQHQYDNDPVQFHLARVDLARMMMFFKEGAIPADPKSAAEFSPPGRFSGWGWNISEFYDYILFLEVIRSQSEAR